VLVLTLGLAAAMWYIYTTSTHDFLFTNRRTPIDWSGFIELAFIALTGYFVSLITVLDFRVGHERLCAKCGYPYDEEAKPTCCPECGSGLRQETALTEGRPWRRKERQYLINAVLILIFVMLLLT